MAIISSHSYLALSLFSCFLLCSAPGTLGGGPGGDGAKQQRPPAWSLSRLPAQANLDTHHRCLPGGWMSAGCFGGGCKHTHTHTHTHAHTHTHKPKHNLLPKGTSLGRGRWSEPSLIFEKSVWFSRLAELFKIAFLSAFLSFAGCIGFTPTAQLKDGPQKKSV